MAGVLRALTATWADRVAPLHTLYDQLRISCMNEIYYAKRITSVRRLSKGVDIVTALTASTAIASWKLWHGDFGSTVWLILTAITTVITAVRPALRWDREVEKLASLHMKYRALTYDIDEIVLPIQASHRIPGDLENRLEVIGKKYRAIAMEDEIIKKRVQKKARAETLQKYPPGAFWIPPEDDPLESPEKERTHAP